MKCFAIRKKKKKIDHFNCFKVKWIQTELTLQTFAKPGGLERETLSFDLVGELLGKYEGRDLVKKESRRTIVSKYKSGKMQMTCFYASKFVRFF